MDFPDPATLHLWLIDADNPDVRDACDVGWLSRVETGCMQACPVRAECTRYALSRCLVRGVLARYLDCPPGAVAVDEAVPGAAARVAGGWRVAWSQGERWVAIAVAVDRPLALEVAPPGLRGSSRPLRAAIASAEERRWLDSLPRRRRAAGLARIRALKVAWLRASGAGGGVELPAVTVVDASGQGTGRLRGVAEPWFCAEPPVPVDAVRVAVAGSVPAAGVVPRVEVRCVRDGAELRGGDAGYRGAAPGWARRPARAS